MKLAICSQGELFGGVERHILDLCRFVERNGHPRPLVALFHDRELARRLREDGRDPVILRGRNRYDRALVSRVRGLMGRAGVDVVHAHGYKATVVCGLAKPRGGWALVKTEHGKLEGTLGAPLRWLKTRLNFALEQAVTRRRVDHVCYVTADIARFFDRRHRGLPRSTIRNGIDPLDRRDHARPPELSAAGFHAGIVGRVTWVKGIDFALEALARPEVPARVTLHVLGDGPLVEPLRARAAALGVGSRVVFHGFRRDVFAFLAHLDALLMPSHHEGLPYTLLEAWSLGCPVIASRVGGPAEVLEGEPGADLVPVGDVPALAAALARRAADDGGGARPGPCPWTLDRMGSAYLDIMRDARARARGEAGP